MALYSREGHHICTMKFDLQYLLIPAVSYPFSVWRRLPPERTVEPPAVASVSMCTYGVLPACVNVTWSYLCLKKAALGGGAAASTLLEAPTTTTPRVDHQQKSQLRSQCAKVARVI